MKAQARHLVRSGRPAGRARVRRPPDLKSRELKKAQILADPVRAKGRFSTVTIWQHGAKAATRARSFVIGTDEPVELGGQDEAVDPMELILAALGACLAIGWVKQAQLRGVVVRDLRVNVDAPYDLRGNLAIDSDVRPGFDQITYTVEVDSDADRATLGEITVATERTSPLFDNLLNGATIKGRTVRIRRPAVSRITS